MSDWNDVYSAPTADEEEPIEGGEGGGQETDAPPAVWFALPIWRLWLFSLLGGGLYQAYWMYRSWRAFRASDGYSRHALWQARHAANGFRVSAFWRAATVFYSYCFLVVVEREARRAQVSGFGPPWLWFALQLAAITVLPFGWNLVALSLAFVPAQLTVNRLHDKLNESRKREPIRAAELCWLAAGLATTLSVVGARS